MTMPERYDAPIVTITTDDTKHITVTYRIDAKPLRWKRAVPRGNMAPWDSQKNAKLAIGLIVKAQHKDIHGKLLPVFKGPIWIRVLFFFSVTSSKRDWRYMIDVPDASNCIKLIEDAIKGVSYDDDKQIVGIYPEKHWCPDRKARTELQIIALREFNPE